MRFLVDASLSPSVAQTLKDAGHDAVHVSDVMPLDAPDETIFDYAAADDRVIVAADTDFGGLLAQRAAKHPSLILFRRRTGPRPADQAALILTHLPDVEHDLIDGAAIVFQETRIRVRHLPISGSQK